MKELLSPDELSANAKKVIYTLIGMAMLIVVTFMIDKNFGKVTLGVICVCLLIMCIVYLSNRLIDSYKRSSA